MVPSKELEADRAVIEAVQQGDREAFAELARREGDWVRGVIFAVLGDAQRTEDVFQQVWASAWSQSNQLRDVKRWRGWLYRLARNAALDAGRRATRQRRRDDEYSRGNGQVSLPGRTTVMTDSPRERMIRAEQREAVLNALAALSPLYREPFVLKHVQGWSYREIADVMGIPVDTVETRLVRARRLLRDALRDKV